MTDREKVMKGLRCLSSPYAQDVNGRDCENCQYDNSSCFLDITADALALLKEQEPKKPIASEDSNSFRRYNCPKCGRWFEFYKPAYCDKCGQAVKWK